MENGRELREEKEVVMEGIEPSVTNGSAISDDHSYALHEDKTEEVDLQDSKPVDYSNLGKKEFVGLLKEAASKNDFKKADEMIREIKPLFDEIRLRERTEALLRFKIDGGKEDDFLYKGD